MRIARAAIVLSCVAGLSLSAQSNAKKFIPLADSQAPAPVSAAVSAGGFVYTAGMQAGDVRADVATQANQAFAALRHALTAAGSSFDNVVAVNMMVKNPADLLAIDGVYRAQFTGALPARTVYLAHNMSRPGALLEIQMTAVGPGMSRVAVTPPEWMKPDGPYSYGMLGGDTLFTSAMEPRDYKTLKRVHGDLAAQVTAGMQNAADLLKAAGMSLDDTVSSRVANRGAEVSEEMNATYGRFQGPSGGTRMQYRGGVIGPYDFQITFIAVSPSVPREVVIPARPDGTPGRANPAAFFAPGIKVGNRVYVSGGTGLTKDNVGDIRAQTKEIISRLGANLKAAGFDFKDVVQTEVELPDMSVFGGMNDAYKTFFPAAFPARHMWGVNGLNNKDALIEVGLMAVR